MYKMINMGKVRLLNVLAEAALIIFSILLALYTNNWRQERAAHQRVDRDLAAVRVELQQDRAIIADAQPYDEQEVETFRQFLGRPDLDKLVRGKDMFEVIRANRQELKWHGIWHPNVTPSSLSDTAWKTAVANGDLPFMAPDLVKALTDYYTFQDSGLVSCIQQSSEVYGSPAPYDRSQTITMLRTLQGTYYNLSDFEGSLLEQVDKTLQAMPEK
ncbi:MAG TPA: hypothetical protein VGO35_04755 [Gammaproteobacteria bacterium]|nr:hypothetical protein [Gammaproteobacteria bacterium]